MWQALARYVGLPVGKQRVLGSRGPLRGRIQGRATGALPRSTLGWIGMALLVVVMQTAGLAHRIQHGDAAIPGLTTAMWLASENGDAGGADAKQSAGASLEASVTPGSTASAFPSSDAHFGHSCVLFDGDALFVGGAVFVSSLAPLLVGLAAPPSFAFPSPDLAPLRAFLSRAPPRDIRSALA